MKHHFSIKTKFFAAIVAVAVLFIALLSVLNLCFYDDYYFHTRERMLEGIYHTVQAQYDGNVDNIASVLDSIENSNGMRASILSSDGTIQYASFFGFSPDEQHIKDDPKPPEQNTSALPGDAVFSPDAMHMGRGMQQVSGILLANFVMENTDLCALRDSEPQIQTIDMPDKNDRYLCLIGRLSATDEYLLVYLPFAFIEQNSSFNLFFLLVTGSISLLVCFLLAFLISRQFARPLIKMSGIANDMVRFDFSQKYDGRETDEIGQLGQSINRLSAYLEQAIGDLQRSNTQLAQEVREKERIDNMRREFIVNVSHELKTPIALIQGYAEGLQCGIADNPEDRQFYCETIADEAGHMNRLVMQLLALSKLELGSAEPYYEELDLAALCREAKRKTAVLCDSKQLQVDCPTDSLLVHSDASMLDQVVMNYLSNAIRYTAPGGRIALRCMAEQAGARLSVFNEGDGLPEEELPMIWEKFYRTDRARSRENGGTGIGLSLVRAIAETLHGDCGAQNVEGGLEFWFTLPNDGESQ